ncbi:MAG: DsrE family protein [Candidatus Sericytochromatia bacterium]|nr:DsrE family protein [Candidatus Sericytochromatia bacterium]
MARYVMIALVAALAAAWPGTRPTLAAEGVPAPPRHRVVLELTSDATASWEAVLNNIENARKALGPDQTTVELVVHGPGIGLVTRANPMGQARMEGLAAQGVVFAACRNTMNRKKLTDADLQPFVTVVPAGVAEVVMKQEAGWSYLKAGH